MMTIAHKHNIPASSFFSRILELFLSSTDAVNLILVKQLQRLLFYFIFEMRYEFFFSHTHTERERERESEKIGQVKEEEKKTEHFFHHEIESIFLCTDHILPT